MTEDTSVADAADGVGDELARARSALGLSVADIARQLKFAARQIDAMEQGRFEDLPSGTFARGMVRSYARLLKLDAEPLVRRMAARVSAPDNAGAVASTRRPIPITDSNRRGNLIYAALSVAILGVVAAVVFEWQRDNSNAARLSFVPAARVPVEPQRLAAASSPGTPVDLKPADIAAPQPVSETPRVAPARAAEGNRRITLKFERASWVEIRGRDGKALLSQLNPAGSEKAVEGRPPFALIIGNAQHVQLSYDDRQIDLAPHVKVEVARFTLE
ncbi:MAG: helix-turn-helix domain-containing protein [Betaproteobacteria bacterium]